LDSFCWQPGRPERIEFGEHRYWSTHPAPALPLGKTLPHYADGLRWLDGVEAVAGSRCNRSLPICMLRLMPL